MPKEERTPRSRIQEPTSEELRRLDDLLRQVGGPNVSWGAVNRLEVWMAETRLEAERTAARRVLVATWMLVLATCALVVATVALICAG